METKYYAYYKPPHNVELMNNIKDELINEYSQEIVRPLLLKIFNNINNNDTDEYLCIDKQNYYLILIKMTLVNEIFIKEETIDKSQYTLISKSIDWNAKKLKIHNINQYYSFDTNTYYNKTRTVLFNGSGNNQVNNNETQYIFAEYLTIPITNIINFYKEIKFDVDTNTPNTSNTPNTVSEDSIFTQSLNKYHTNNLITESFITNIFILLNNILSKVEYTTSYHENLLLKRIIPYIGQNTDYISIIWNELYKQPTNAYDVFSNHNLIIENNIIYNSLNLNQKINCNVFTYLYITQKQFSCINYKDALPFRLSFDTNFKYNGTRILINHNKELDNMNKHTLEIDKIKGRISNLLRTKPPTDNSIIKMNETIDYHETEISIIQTKLNKIDPYYKDHLLFNTNIGFKLTFEPELNAYKPLLYLRYMCNNYNRLNNDLLLCYDNITDKRNDILQFYISNKLINELLTMKVKPDLFTISRLFNITTEDKYQDGKYKITNHEINKTFEINNKSSKIYQQFSKFLEDNINLKLFEYQKNNLLWMLKLEDNIDLHKIIIESYINKFNINYNNVKDIKTFIYGLRSFIPEVICKDYFINVLNDKKYSIDIKNTETVIYHSSLITALNSNNIKAYSKNTYNNYFNVIDSIITPKDYKAKYTKNIEFCGGAICDEVGLGKTLSIISHLVLKLKHDMLKYDTYTKEMNVLVNTLNTDDKFYDNTTNVFIDPIDKGFEFNNLIIVPSRLTSQWENEIEKYVKSKFNLRAKVLIGINSIKSLEKELTEFHINKSKTTKNTKTTKITKTTKTTDNLETIDKSPIISNIRSTKLVLKKQNVKIEIEKVNDIKSIIQNIPIITPVVEEELIQPILKKQSKEEKLIEKLMLKAKKINDSNTPKKLITFKKQNYNKSNNTINNILNNINSNTDIDNGVEETGVATGVEETEVETEVATGVEETEVEDTGVEYDDMYNYVNKYLEANQNNTNILDNSYISDQLYDIYIISSNLLINENYLNHIQHTSDNHLKTYYEGETNEIQQKNKLNIIKEYYKNNKDSKDSKDNKDSKDSKDKTNYKICRLSDKFNIYKIKWNRVILDEAHEKLCPTIKMFSSSLSKYINRTKSVTYDGQFIYENLCIINSNYKWAMTGTPTEQGIDTIMGILQFLKVKNYNEDIMKQINNIRCLSDTIGISPDNFDILLNTVFKKTYKKDVKTLLNIPLFTEEIIYVEQNNIERNIYNSMRCSRHYTDIVKNRNLFLMCTNILISNEFDVDGECSNNTKDSNAETEFLTLEQLNTNMVSKFNQQLKQLLINKTQLIKKNNELSTNIQYWINLVEYISNLKLDDCIESRILLDINNKFGDLDNNRIRYNCEVFYNIISAFEIWKNHSSIGFILNSNINIIRDHLFRIWDTTWNTNESILIKCSESGAKLGVIKVKDEITKNEKKINSFDNDKTRINNQIALFSNNDFLKDKTNDPCIICFDDLNEIVVTPCRHIFCLTCTKKLSNELRCNFTCPECRTIIDYKTVNITNIDMINKKKEDVVEEVNSVIEVSSGSGEVGPELTELEKKLGKDWKNKCTNKYGSKMCRLIEYLYTIFVDPINRVIIFSQYEKMLKMIAKTLEEYQIKFVHCAGNNYVINRNIMKFKKDDSYRVILLSAENANSGANLTESSHVILVDVLQHDTEQTKAIEFQAIGRAIRLGQSLSVKIVRFITKGTIEEEHYNNTKYDINIFQN
jgi:SNF2 family DNA or RNA helicase